MLLISVLNVFLLFRYPIFTATADANAKNFRRRCSLSGARNYGGVCKLLQECPSAISNLRAGVTPTICVHVGKVAVVCCPVERRISFQKCQEYSKITDEPGEKARPLLPLGYQEDGTNEDADQTDVSSGGFPRLFIVGGSDTYQDEFPHAVRLLKTLPTYDLGSLHGEVALGYASDSKRDEVSWRCSGTLISEEFVLTAAHCLQKTNRGKLTQILLGDVKLTGNDTSRSRAVVNVSTVLNHPNYAAGLKYNDIGLIKLKSKVKLSSSIRPACLPQPSDRLELSSDPLIAHGWGLTEFAGSPSEVLQSVKLTRFSLADCNKEYIDQPDRNYTFPRGIVNTQVCAGERNKDEAKDTCEGDSGGGLVNLNHNMDLKIYYVVGITSFGSKYCGYGPPGVYTNVQSYLDWIEGNVWP